MRTGSALALSETQKLRFTGLQAEQRWLRAPGGCLGNSGHWGWDSGSRGSSSSCRQWLSLPPPTPWPRAPGCTEPWPKPLRPGARGIVWRGEIPKAGWSEPRSRLAGTPTQSEDTRKGKREMELCLHFAHSSAGLAVAVGSPPSRAADEDGAAGHALGSACRE